MSGDNLPAPDGPAAVTIAPAGEADLAELLVLMRGYCDFYEVEPADEDLLALCRTLIADPARQGVQLIARGPGGEALGFATLYWSWSTSRAAPLGTMNDLFVIPQARGLRIGERLIEACVERCAEHGAREMEWQTAPDNARAQALYDRIGGRHEPWLCYSLPVPRP
ncbi:MAG TPA: GNAT family N-acetyltransferase [Solirubrobacteraceae bacterium]|nr:GNAT family N-acetyltransferase [Solirubrobacteraceae bacterium]